MTDPQRGPKIAPATMQKEKTAPGRHKVRAEMCRKTKIDKSGNGLLLNAAANDLIALINLIGSNPNAFAVNADRKRQPNRISRF